MTLKTIQNHDFPKPETFKTTLPDKSRTTAGQLSGFCPAKLSGTCPAVVRQGQNLEKHLKKPMVFQGFGLPDNGRTIAGQKPDNCRTIVRLLSGKVVRHLSGKAKTFGGFGMPDNCRTSAGQLPDKSRTTAGQLSGNCPAVVRLIWGPFWEP